MVFQGSLEHRARIEETYSGLDQDWVLARGLQGKEKVFEVVDPVVQAR